MSDTYAEEGAAHYHYLCRKSQQLQSGPTKANDDLNLNKKKDGAFVSHRIFADRFDVIGATAALRIPYRTIQ